MWVGRCVVVGSGYMEEVCDEGVWVYGGEVYGA